ncbi:hypothetical protein [Candidatus Magnetobacterium casense]|uniref:XkdX family protein n=1 Tax=Candidatus Magnetobacterium casense TaxID=1455061 RepID=A0ABS6S449_9BACT|nr:hypothetical protein [Candidatus Magnetobacterium casensis]MBV6343417.1 hypothetical protein [Candidatus Magnetobacterium casensis]
MNPYVEIAKLLLQAVFTLIAMGKMTAEEFEKAYAEEKTKFQANPPDTLPDV